MYSLEEIQEKIKLKQTTWIQELNKEELIAVAEKLSFSLSSDATLDTIRKEFRDIVKSAQLATGINKPSTQPTAMSCKMSSIQPFAGGNWKSYIEQFKCYLLLNDVEERKKVPLLITKLSPDVYEKLCSLCTPKSPVDCAFEFIGEELDKYYHPRTSIVLNKAIFRKRMQQEGETIDNFILELKGLSKKCNFKDLDEQLKERLVDGARSEVVRYELLKAGDKSLEELITLAKTVEVAYNQTNVKDDSHKHE